jgi:5'-deoxynucleotidase YfbR-like HD superfamily hydrolase
MTTRPEFDPRQIIDFLNLTARLKSELRHCCDSTDTRAGSVAEHCFQMSLFTLLVHRYLDGNVDVARLLKLCICHDLVEAIAGDTPHVEGADRTSKRQKEEEGRMLRVISRGLSRSSVHARRHAYQTRGRSTSDRDSGARDRRPR